MFSLSKQRHTYTSTLHTVTHTHTCINICCCVSWQCLQPDSWVSEGSKALAIPTYLPPIKTWLTLRVVTGQRSERQHSTVDSVTPPLLSTSAPPPHLAPTSNDDTVWERGPSFFCDGILWEIFPIGHLIYSSSHRTKWIIYTQHCFIKKYIFTCCLGHILGAAARTFKTAYHFLWLWRGRIWWENSIFLATFYLQRQFSIILSL